MHQVGVERYRIQRSLWHALIVRRRAYLWCVAVVAAVTWLVRTNVRRRPRVRPTAVEAHRAQDPPPSTAVRRRRPYLIRRTTYIVIAAVLGAYAIVLYQGATRDPQFDIPPGLQSP